MTLFRPKVKAWLGRWGESTGSALLVIFGLWMLRHGVLRYNWMTELVGGAFTLLGGAVFWASFQRSRFAGYAKGTGLVEVTERQISYLTSGGGNSVDLEALTRLEMRSSLYFGRVWVLKQSEGATMFIPVDATGSEKLFDAFAALPGIDVARLIAAAHAKGDHRDVIWRGAAGYRPLT